jgi:hypothetical protein
MLSTAPAPPKKGAFSIESMMMDRASSASASIMAPASFLRIEYIFSWKMARRCSGTQSKLSSSFLSPDLQQNFRRRKKVIDKKMLLMKMKKSIPANRALHPGQAHVIHDRHGTESMPALPQGSHAQLVVLWNEAGSGGNKVQYAAYSFAS